MAQRQVTSKTSAPGRKAKVRSAHKTQTGAYYVKFNRRWDSIGLKQGTTVKAIDALKAGLPFKSLDTFHKFTDLPMQVIADAVQIPPRTLARRKSGGRLQPDESERLLRISSVFEKAVELFDGDRDAAMRWLTTPQPALDSATPFDFARTELGAREVEDLIGRLEHGVYT